MSVSAHPYDQRMARQRAVLLDAHTHLDGRDPVLDLLMATHGPARLPSPAPSNRRFHDLAESIAYQQLNGVALALRVEPDGPADEPHSATLPLGDLKALP